MPETQPKSPNVEYVNQAIKMLASANYVEALDIYETVLEDDNIDDYCLAALGRSDRFFLLSYLLNRSDLYNPWLYDRCREVEAETDGYLDLWAREHYKSTLITFAGSIQEILNDPEITIGIFSHTRPIAKSFLSQIKQEFESNLNLIRLYPNVLYTNPKREAPYWSLDSGIVVKRKTNPKEATVEAHGLVDGQPTSKHFKLMIYDDVVTRESVYTPDMIIKTTDAWELSRNLSSRSVDRGKRRTWYIGTRYNFADTYRVMLDRNAAKARVHAATDNGLPDGNPVFLTEEDWQEKKGESSAATIACQQLLNPTAGQEQEFHPDWIRRWEVRPETLNVAICVDPANSKKKGSSNTAMAVIGMDAAHNKYLLDGFCHKMSLTERWKNLKSLHKKWIRTKGIQVVTVGYERYGMQTDIEHFQEMMLIERYSFPIEEVSWPVQRQEGSKVDRIRRLIPDHQNWRFFYPYEGYNEIGKLTRTMEEVTARGQGHLVAKPIKQTNQDTKVYNLTEYLLANEYLFFPATTHLDLMDAMSRIYDLIKTNKFGAPMKVRDEDVLPEWHPDF